jgi:transcriptional antiterminator RfaH
MSTDTPAWYVIRSKPHKEKQVNSYLKEQGFEVFYPTIRVKPANPRSSTVRPYFPGYLFVYTDISDTGMSALQWVPGATGLVQFGGQPAPVPEHVVQEIRKHVEQIEQMGGLSMKGLKSGEPVRITHGPMAGYEAIFDLRLSGADRVQVLLEMLGRQVKVQIDAAHIEKR